MGGRGRGRGISRRGGTVRGRGRGGRYAAKVKTEPQSDHLSSDPQTLTDKEDAQNEEEIVEIPVKRGTQKAKRGKPFARSSPVIRKKTVKPCSVSLEREEIKDEEKIEKKEKDTEINKGKKKVKKVTNVVKRTDEKEVENKEDESVVDNKICDDKEVENKEDESVVDNKICDDKEVENKEDESVVDDKICEDKEESADGKKSENKEKTFTIQTMQVYGNDANVFSGSKRGTIVENVNKCLGMSVGERLEEHKDRLRIQKLEEDIQNVLESRLKVKDSKKRIERLEVILELLSKVQDKEEKQLKEVDEKGVGNLRSENVIEDKKEKMIEIGSDAYVKEEKKNVKHVTFEIVKENESDKEEMEKIQIDVDKALKVVSGKIDQEYEDFPSSQVSGEKYMEKLKEKYSVQTEDITDDDKVDESKREKTGVEVKKSGCNYVFR